MLEFIMNVCFMVVSMYFTFETLRDIKSNLNRSKSQICMLMFDAVAFLYFAGCVISYILGEYNATI